MGAVNGFGFEERPVPFSPKRCMFESNFPPDKDSCSYRVLWNMFKRVAARKSLSAEDKKWIFHDCAVKTYKLDEDYFAKLWAFFPSPSPAGSGGSAGPGPLFFVCV